MRPVAGVVFLATVAVALSAASASAQIRERPISLPLTRQTGPYTIAMEMDPSLPDHTIYRPRDLGKVREPMPIVAYGNGGCVDVGNTNQQLLAEIASHGYFIVAGGPIDQAMASGGPVNFAAKQDSTSQLIETIDWAEQQEVKPGSPYHGRLNVSKIAVAGQSCGGLQAIAAGSDPRISTVVVLNSGIIRSMVGLGRLGADGPPRRAGGPAPAMMMPAKESDLEKLHTPLLYLDGGPTDIAYQNAEDDFKAINKLPLFNGATREGHGGTWFDLDGGFMGQAVVAWLDWQLKGSMAAAREFVGVDCGLCKDPRWTVKKKNIS